MTNYPPSRLSAARARACGWLLFAALVYPLYVGYALFGHTLSPVEQTVLAVFLAIFLVELTRAAHGAVYPGAMPVGPRGATLRIDALLAVSGICAAGISGSLGSLIAYALLCCSVLYRPARELIRRR